MTNDIREKAEALVKRLEEEDCCNVGTTEFLDLKAALRPSREKAYNIKGEHVGYTCIKDGTRYFESIEKATTEPSREEIADYLENYNTWRRGADIKQPEPKELGEYLELAIEELRRLT